MITVQTSVGDFSYHDGISDITLSDKIDFADHTRLFHKAKDSDSAITHLIVAVRVFIPDLPDNLNISDDSDDKPLIASDSISVIGLHNHYTYLIEQYYLDVIESIIEHIDLESLEPQERKFIEDVGQMTDLLDYAQVVMLLSQKYGNAKITNKFDRYNFQFKGKRFYISVKESAKWFDGVRYNLGQVSLVKEFRNRFFKKLESINPGELGLSLYKLNLYEIAVLCLQKGEEIPAQPAAQTKWISDRQKFFEDIPMTLYYDICFFLTISFIKSVRIRTINMLSKKLNVNTKEIANLK